MSKNASYFTTEDHVIITAINFKILNKPEISLYIKLYNFQIHNHFRMKRKLRMNEYDGEKNDSINKYNCSNLEHHRLVAFKC